MTHHLNILAGQEYRMPVRLVDAAGHAVPIADYDLYGAARRGAETTLMSVVVVDGSSCVAIIPPLEQASYTYDLYLRHRSTTAEVQLLAGNIAVRGRVAAMPPVTGGGEDVLAVVSADMTEVQVTVTPIAVATPDAWDRLDRAGDLLADAIETAGALVPDAQRVIRHEVETGQSAIAEAAADAVRQAGADIASAGDREVASAAARIRAVSGEEADAIAAAGDTATSEALATISTAVDGGINAIDDGIIRGTTALNNATNSGVTAIGQSITAGTSEIQAATTAGTGTINTAVSAGKSSIDSYVATTQADLARKSQPNIWGGVQTINAPLVANGGIIAQGADLIQTLYLSACYDAAAFSTAAGWANQSNGATSGTGYNAIANGTESGVTYYGAIARGTLTLTNADAHAVVKELAIWSDSFEANIGVTAVIRTNSNTFWSDAGAKTAYAIGASMRTSGNVPHETLIDTSYTPSVGGVPTVCLTSDRGAERIRVDIFIKTIHRQILLPKIQNVSHRSYPQEFLCVFGPNRFMLLWLPSYPATDWQCVCSIRSSASLGTLYRSNIIGANGTSSFDIKLSVGTLGLNELTRKGYGDWMEPMISIQI